MPRVFQQLATFGGAAALVAAVFTLLCFVVLPKEQRYRARMPTAMLGLFALAAVVHVITSPEHVVHDAFGTIGLFFLMLSLARTTFLLLYHGIVVRSMSREAPRIIGDLVQGLFFAAALTVVLRAVGVEIGSLLGASALLTAVIGFALQDTLGNLFSGLAMQMQAPFEVGDFISYDSEELHIGCVVEMNWRAVRLMSIERVEMTVPNTTLAKALLQNYSRPSKVVRRSVRLAAPAELPPERVHRVVIAAVGSVRGVLPTPEPVVLTREFDERGVVYEVLYFITDFALREVIASAVRDRIWYALQRAGTNVPMPRRTLHVHEVNRDTIARQEAVRAGERLETLNHVDFLAALPDDAKVRLVEGARSQLFAKGERIICEGEVGHELFIIRSGRVRVMVKSSKRGEVEVAQLGPNQFFGEMSLMTGEQRKASVDAIDETELLVIDKEAFRPILDSSPKLAETISDVLAARALELGEEASADRSVHEGAQGRTSGMLLTRIKSFFSLGSSDSEGGNS
jgi:small-conductance mechanosensitive channel/CRP-like cAMP-binding protein